MGAVVFQVPSNITVGPQLSKFMNENEITFFQSTPIRLQSIAEDNLPFVEVICVTGEACPVSLVRRFDGKRVFINHYGTSETTATAMRFSKLGNNKQMIGKLNANHLAYILDKNMQPVPIGIPGEIYIGGAGVSWSCFDERPAEASFLPNPFLDELKLTPEVQTVLGNRIYKSGDFGKWLPDGTIDFLARKEKINGIRIELHEIKAAIEKCSGVSQAEVLLFGGPDSTQILVGYITPNIEKQEKEIRAQLAKAILPYMVPQLLVFMDQFPHDENYNVDRKQLFMPAFEEVGEEFQSNEETILLQLWSEVLKLKPHQIKRYDRFFALGGDSITSTILAHKAKQRGLNITIRQVLENHTIPAQAAACTTATTTPI